MKFSISTKVFLGFIVVLLVFGFSSLYTVVRTGEIRDRVVLLREGIVPIEKEVQKATEELVSLRGLLMQRKPRKGVLNRLDERLASKQKDPFQLFSEIENRADVVLQEAESLNLGNRRLLQLDEGLSGLRRGTDISVKSKGGLEDSYRQLDGNQVTYMTNQQVYDLARVAFQEAMIASDYETASKWYTELRSIVGEVLRKTRDLKRTTSLCISEVNQEARENESRVVRDVIFTSIVALIISILVMFLTHQGIKRIRVLIQGVRSVSKGQYEFSASVTGHDEIAELATEFSKMAENLRERNEQLEDQSQALIRSERFATIGKISTLITHEIRNPLSSIGLNAEMLEEELSSYEGSDTSEGKNLLRAIGAEVDRLRDVTEEYLQFARLPKPELERTDIIQLVNNVAQFLEPEMLQHQIEMKVTDAGQPILGMVDSNQIRQALLNLIRNSTEAMAGAGGQILIHLKHLDEKVFVIRIEDSGPGVPFEVQPHIFEAFYSTKPSGTGMGLSLVQQIVTEHGGGIRCQRSAALGGANFVLRFPKA